MSAATVATRESPILFSGPMVRAILDGRKAQTRRVVKLPAYLARNGFSLDGAWVDRGFGDGQYLHTAPHPEHEAVERVYCPYGCVGDWLWAREGSWIFGQWHPDGLTERGRARWRFAAIGQQVRFERPGEGELTYWGSDTPGYAHRPSIFMPGWASRLTLEITDVRVARVQAISEADAVAEGAQPDTSDLAGYTPHVSGFAYLWQTLNGPRGYGWDANPWVWAISFRVVPDGAR